MVDFTFHRLNAKYNADFSKDKQFHEQISLSGQVPDPWKQLGTEDDINHGTAA